MHTLSFIELVFAAYLGISSRLHTLLTKYSYDGVGTKPWMSRPTYPIYLVHTVAILGYIILIVPLYIDDRTRAGY